METAGAQEMSALWTMAPMAFGGLGLILVLSGGTNSARGGLGVLLAVIGVVLIAVHSWAGEGPRDGEPDADRSGPPSEILDFDSYRAAVLMREAIGPAIEEARRTQPDAVDAYLRGSFYASRDRWYAEAVGGDKAVAARDRYTQLAALRVLAAPDALVGKAIEAKRAFVGDAHPSHSAACFGAWMDFPLHAPAERAPAFAAHLDTILALRSVDLFADRPVLAPDAFARMHAKLVQEARQRGVSGGVIPTAAQLTRPYVDAYCWAEPVILLEVVPSADPNAAERALYLRTLSARLLGDARAAENRAVQDG